MVPIAAAGVITLPTLYPITLGANVGTTLTALLASLATERPEAPDHRAGAHPVQRQRDPAVLRVPVLRDVPVRIAQGMAGRMAEDRRLLTLYVGGVFVVVPLVGMLVFG